MWISTTSCTYLQKENHFISAGSAEIRVVSIASRKCNSNTHSVGTFDQSSGWLFSRVLTPASQETHQQPQPGGSPLPKAAASSVGLGREPRFTSVLPSFPKFITGRAALNSQCNVLPIANVEETKPKALINHSPAPGTISNFYYLKNDTCSTEQSMVHLVL